MFTRNFKPITVQTRSMCTISNKVIFNYKGHQLNNENSDIEFYGKLTIRKEDFQKIEKLNGKELFVSFDNNKNIILSEHDEPHIY